MKTKLINVPSLYPDFTPYVAKYGDNGMASIARSKEGRGGNKLFCYFF